MSIIIVLFVALSETIYELFFNETCAKIVANNYFSMHSIYNYFVYYNRVLSSFCLAISGQYSDEYSHREWGYAVSGSIRLFLSGRDRE